MLCWHEGIVTLFIKQRIARSTSLLEIEGNTHINTFPGSCARVSRMCMQPRGDQLLMLSEAQLRGLQRGILRADKVPMFSGWRGGPDDEAGQVSKLKARDACLPNLPSQSNCAGCQSYHGTPIFKELIVWISVSIYQFLNTVYQD